MEKKFGGFTEPQREVLARKMGFDGPMDQFGKFLQSSPDSQQKYVSYEQKAQQALTGGVVPQPKPGSSFAGGGLVDERGNPIPRRNAFSAFGPFVKRTPTATKKTSLKSINEEATTSAGATLTNTAINNPSSIITPTTTTPIATNAQQFLDPTTGQVVASPNVEAANTGPTAQAVNPNVTPAPTVDTALTGEATKTATDGFQAAQGSVTAESQVKAATALPSSNATVQGQLANLMQQFEGGETPVWAAGAIRNANAIMAQRGLGSSSIAGGAVTQAAMESAISIAAQDASTFSQFEMQNLNNRQQARLVNAQSFLQMDLANLDKEQQMTMFKSQSIIQSLFTDQAAENASRQFNASSQGQTDQFFANLKTQVSQFNAAQSNTMSQFKAGQKDSISMFNKQMNNATDQFNAQNRLVIDQSNAEWRRAVTTADNATINEANRLNAQSATGMTLAGYNNLMQRERDMYSFAFQSSENAAQRASDLAIAKMQGKEGSKGAMGSALGSLAGTVVKGLFGGFG